MFWRKKEKCGGPESCEHVNSVCYATYVDQKNTIHTLNRECKALVDEVRSQAQEIINKGREISEREQAYLLLKSKQSEIDTRLGELRRLLEKRKRMSRKEITDELVEELAGQNHKLHNELIEAVDENEILRKAFETLKNSKTEG